MNVHVCSIIFPSFSLGVSFFFPFPVTPSCPVGYSQGPPCFGGKCFFNGYECMNRKCCKKAVTSTCPTGHLTGPACSSTGTCSSKGYDCMKDINMCCLKLQVISPCLSTLSDGSCKTDTDCKSGYTCKIGTCCKTPVLTPSSCPSFLSAGSCEKDTDCESSYKCESGTCCRSFVPLPSYPRGTRSSGTCAGGRKCDGSCPCGNDGCCKSPSFSEYTKKLIDEYQFFAIKVQKFFHRI